MSELVSRVMIGVRENPARVALSLFLVLVSAFFLWQSTFVPDPPRNVGVGPRTFPFLISGAMLLASLYVLFRECLSARGIALVEEEEAPPEVSDWQAVWAALIAIVILIGVIEYLGFILSLTAFLGGLATFFAPDRWRRNFIVGVCFSLFFYFLFTWALMLPLPNGILTPLF